VAEIPHSGFLQYRAKKCCTKAENKTTTLVIGHGYILQTSGVLLRVRGRALRAYVFLGS
jgi:hypothetical protein